MSIRILRAHRRHAVRAESVIVPAASGRKARGLSVLLIELSAEGARISGLDQRALAEGGRVTLRISGQEELGAQVRWAHDGCAGLMFDVPFHVAELAALVAACRPAPAPAPIAGAAALRMAG